MPWCLKIFKMPSLAVIATDAHLPARRRTSKMMGQPMLTWHDWCVFFLGSSKSHSSKTHPKMGLPSDASPANINLLKPWPARTLLLPWVVYIIEVLLTTSKSPGREIDVDVGRIGRERRKGKTSKTMDLNVKNSREQENIALFGIFPPSRNSLHKGKTLWSIFS